MRKQSSGDLFWVSFSDLMTALFIVMLTLFVLSYKSFKVKEEEVEKQALLLAMRASELTKQDETLRELRRLMSEQEMNAYSLIEQLENERNRLEVMEEEYKKLREIQEAISRLNPEDFEYQPDYKRHILRRQVQFRTGSAAIDSVYQASLRRAGLELMRLVTELDHGDMNIKYLMVIEGQASKDNYSRNYELSYERALSLFKLWEGQGIRFDPNRVEVIIAGSGERGVGRASGNETKNQRFIIQIIPKIGELEAISTKEEIDEKVRGISED